MAASDSATISDSHDDSAIDFCFREPQHRGAPCQYTFHPEVEARIGNQFYWIQENLFTIGSILATAPGFTGFELSKVTEVEIKQLEVWIDKASGELPELKNFISYVQGNLALILLIIVIIGILFSDTIINIFAPGFTMDDPRYTLASEMLKITFPYLLFIPSITRLLPIPHVAFISPT